MHLRSINVSKILKFILVAAVATPALFVAILTDAQSADQPTAAELARQIEALRRDYESRIQALESQISKLEQKSKAAEAVAATPAYTSKAKSDNTFNPALGVILTGLATDFSSDESNIPGFQFGHEGERPSRGLSLGHSEITASSNVDDKFFGSLTLGLASHGDGADEVEVEEAYIQTLPGAGLPEGVRIKAGRALWTFGYLNEHHAHSDDFADRPLPYRTFLDYGYNDDGVELSMVLPTDLYTEIGGGIFRGGDTPFGGSEDGFDAWSAYARLGGDIGRDGAWRIGGYGLSGKAHNRGPEHAHDEHADEHMDEGGDAHDEEEHEEHEFFSAGTFTGDARIYGVDFRGTFAPTGNARDREWIFQGEYFWRKEDGTYSLEEEGVIETEYFDATSRGWYAQAVYKFLPQWRAALRYSQLTPPDEAGLHHDPSAFALMFDWTNSEFGRIRFQYNREELAHGRHDNQFLLQYIMSIGAHAAHAF